jgi:hypothetical protein
VVRLRESDAITTVFDQYLGGITHMDPITIAIIATLSAGVTSGTTDVAKKAIMDSYEGLKGLLKKKYGGTSDVADAIDKLQVKPDSPGHRTVLAEELTKANAAADPELLSAAQSLLTFTKALPRGEQHVQQIAQGIGIAQASAGSTATASVSGLRSNGSSKD